MSYTLSLGAEADVADIYGYTERVHGSEQADEHLLNLFREIQKRAEDPYFATRGEVEIADRLGLQQVRSFLYRGYHRCYFTFDDEGLFVLAVYHGRRDKDKFSGR